MTHEVLVTPEGVWDATLNQTDVSNHANKYATGSNLRERMSLTRRGVL